jgi:CheY-like chemotaxis protein
MEGSTDGRLKGLRVLVVEDEAIVSLLLCDFLEHLGCNVVGPVHDVESALNAVRQPVDCATLDLDGDDDMTYRIAEALSDRHIPFILTTGYRHVDGRFASVPCVLKPFDNSEVQRALLKVVTVVN